MKSLSSIINEAMIANDSLAPERKVVFEWDDRLIQNDSNVSNGAIKEYRDTELKDNFIKMVSNMLRFDWEKPVPYKVSEDTHKPSYTYTFQMSDDTWNDFVDELHSEVEGWLKRKNKKHKMDAYINKKANFEGIQILCPTNIKGEVYYLNIKLV